MIYILYTFTYCMPWIILIAFYLLNSLTHMSTQWVSITIVFVFQMRMKNSGMVSYVPKSQLINGDTGIWTRALWFEPWLLSVVLLSFNLYIYIYDIFPVTTHINICSVSGRSPGGRNGNPLQYFYLGKSVDRGAWQATGPWDRRVRHDWATKHVPMG